MRDWGYIFLRLVGIRTRRSFRLTIRAIALLVGLSAAFYLSVLLAKKEFEIAWYVFLVVIVAAFVEFVFADVLVDRSFPFDTERKLALMEKRLGAQVIEAITQRIKDLVAEFRDCDTALISATVHVFAELTATADQRIREGLLQLTDYVGPNGGKKGRITLINLRNLQSAGVPFLPSSPRMQLWLVIDQISLVTCVGHRKRCSTQSNMMLS